MYFLLYLRYGEISFVNITRKVGIEYYNNHYAQKSIDIEKQGPGEGYVLYRITYGEDNLTVYDDEKAEPFFPVTTKVSLEDCVINKTSGKPYSVEIHSKGILKPYSFEINDTEVVKILKEANYTFNESTLRLVSVKKNATKNYQLRKPVWLVNGSRKKINITRLMGNRTANYTVPAQFYYLVDVEDGSIGVFRDVLRTPTAGEGEIESSLNWKRPEFVEKYLEKAKNETSEYENQPKPLEKTSPPEVRLKLLGLGKVKVHEFPKTTEKVFRNIRGITDCYVGRPCGFRIHYYDPNANEEKYDLDYGKAIVKFGDGGKYTRHIYRVSSENQTVSGSFKAFHIYNRSRDFKVTVIINDYGEPNGTASLKVDVLPSNEVPASCTSINLEGKKRSLNDDIMCKCKTAPYVRDFCRCKNGTWKCKYPKEVCREGKSPIKCGEPISQSYPIAKFDILNPIAQGCKVGESCVFNTSGSYDPGEGKITHLKMSFGDGTEESKSEPGRIEHVYQSTQEGVVNVSLTVTDNKGLKDTYRDRINLHPRGVIIKKASASISQKIANAIRKDLKSILNLFR